MPPLRGHETRAIPFDADVAKPVAAAADSFLRERVCVAVAVAYSTSTAASSRVMFGSILSMVTTHPRVRLTRALGRSKYAHPREIHTNAVPSFKCAV